MRREVVVPDAVMDGLEVPDALAGLRLDADEALGKQIVAGPIDRRSSRGRRRGRQVHVVELGIVTPSRPRRSRCRCTRPIRSARCRIRTRRRLRNGVERPEHACRSARRRRAHSRAGALRVAELIGNRAADDDDVAGDERPAQREIRRAHHVADADVPVDLPVGRRTPGRACRSAHRSTAGTRRACRPARVPPCRRSSSRRSREEAAVVRPARLVAFRIVDPARLPGPGIDAPPRVPGRSPCRARRSP